MATPRKLPAVAIDAATIFARIFAGALAVGAIAWGVFFLPVAWRQAPLNRVTAEVLQGHTFPLKTLVEQVQRANIDSPILSFCNPGALHDAVILRLAALEQSIAAADQPQVGSVYASLHKATLTALACSPSDAFAWLTLFWLEVREHGYQLKYAKYLRQSYALGPYEGWIALWRNRLAIAVLDQLPAELSAQAVEEFAGLLETEQLYQETMAIFVTATPATQARIAQRLATAKPIPRQIFARMLYDRGSVVTIPGVDATPTRPWR